jgi:hypothetical protein
MATVRTARQGGFRGQTRPQSRPGGSDKSILRPQNRIIMSFRFLRNNNRLSSHPPMKHFLLLFACFSLSIHLVFADCDQIQGSNGPTRGSAYNVEVYYRDKSNRRKFIILNRNPYDVRVELLIGDERRTRMINANKCEDFVRHGFNDCRVLSVGRAH